MIGLIEALYSKIKETILIIIYTKNKNVKTNIYKGRG